MKILKVEDLEKYCFCQGRRYVENGRLFLSHSGSSIKGCFQGKTLRFHLFSDPIEKGRNAYIRLTVDGKTRRIRLPKGEKKILMDFPNGEHIFEVIKLTEAVNNSFAVESLETDGAFSVYKENHPIKIEFIGDSITTGFGVLAKETYGEYKTKEQDVTKAFSHLAAQALSAEYRVIAAGGWGILKSKYSSYAIPDFYDNVDLLRNRQKCADGFVPDAFIVTLGTNDFSYLSDLSEEKRKKEREEVKAAFIAFLQKLLAKNKPIVLVYGFFEYPDLGVMTEEVWRELDSPLLSTLEVQSANALNDVRAGHPGKRCHRLAAGRLVKTIRALF